MMTNSGYFKLYYLDKALIVGEAAGILDAKVNSKGNYQQPSSRIVGETTGSS